MFVWSDLVEVLEQRSYELDWLVIGSRSYGPVRSVLLGSVIRDAACPMIVVRRGAQVPLEALVATSEIGPATLAAR